jgi:hypothetical protein
VFKFKYWNEFSFFYSLKIVFLFYLKVAGQDLGDFSNTSENEKSAKICLRSKISEI